MTTNKNIEKYLWILTVLFITYLLVGSFVVSSNFIDLAYLLVLYYSIFRVKKISSKK